MGGMASAFNVLTGRKISGINAFERQALEAVSPHLHAATVPDGNAASLNLSA